MSNPIPTDIGLGQQLAQTSNSAPVAVQCDCAEASPEGVFKDILADETIVSAVLAELKKVLPEEVFAEVEQLAMSGNELPLAAIFSNDSPLNGQESQIIPQILEETLDSIEDGTVPPIVNSFQQIGEQLKKHVEGIPKKPFGNIGQNLSEALSSIAPKNEDSNLGKQVQDILATAKSELGIKPEIATKPELAVKIEMAIKDIVPKFTIPTSNVTDAPATPTATINSAISGLAQLSSFQASGGSPLPPAISAPLGEEGWNQAVGERVMWMLGKGVQAASIRITPPNLGPIQVQLSVQNEQASVNILAQHGVVKEALEAAIPRLREMLNESNLQLVNVDINHRESTEQGSRFAMFNNDQREQMEQFLGENDLETPPEEELPRYYRGSGLLDDYA